MSYITKEYSCSRVPQLVGCGRSCIYISHRLSCLLFARWANHLLRRLLLCCEEVDGSPAKQGEDDVTYQHKVSPTLL